MTRMTGGYRYILPTFGILLCGWRTHQKPESAQPALTARQVYGWDHLKRKPKKLQTILGDHHSYIKYTEKTGLDS